MDKLPVEDAWAARLVQKRGRRNAVCGSPVDLKDLENFSCSSYPKTPSDRMFLKGVVCKHPLFMHLKPAQIASIIGAFKKITCNSGDVLIVQGDSNAELFYVVGEGECSVLVSVPEDFKTIKVAAKLPGECFGELALMTISPRAATVLVNSNSATIFTLERQEFQYFLVSSGVHSAHSASSFQGIPEAPELPLDYMVIPKAAPFHPNCSVLLPHSELARSPNSSLSDAGQTTRGSQGVRDHAASVTSASGGHVHVRGLLLQPWPDALNDSIVDVLIPDIDRQTPQKVSAHTLTRLNPHSQGTVENLIDLVHLNAQSVLDVLRNRYEWDLIYTAVGTMLIAVNPYRDIQYSTSKECADHYISASLEQLEVMAPHIFAVATRAWQGLQRANAKPQSIIISGESGAGKTENTKFVLRALSQKRNASSVQDIVSKLLAMNPITEAFGNACTVRNRNSSRFGKFIEISFDSAGEICGCHMHSYLLEKTRVVAQEAGERNYHIFYQILAWADGSLAKQQELLLLPRTTYRYLSGQGDKQFADIKDNEDFLETVDALHECLLSEEDIFNLMRVVVLVANLGNLSFSGLDGKEAVDECEVSDNAAAEACCACMRVKRGDLTRAFCTYVTKMGSTSVTTKIGIVKAGELRDAFAKMTMKLLFDDLVSKINDAFAGVQDESRKIGVLDIFGFEIFEKNSLEQLCINYTNEKLQQLFCHHTFTLEQDLYTHQGIDWDHIPFSDNHVCSDLFEAQGKDPASFGLFKLLEEQCRYSQPTDEGFFLAFKKNWHPSEKEKRGAVSVTPAKLQRDCFTIAHYASDVSYRIHGLVDKNVDAFAPSLRTLIGNIGNPFLKSVFPPSMYVSEEVSDSSNSKRPQGPRDSQSRVDSSKTTVTSVFRSQVLSLMSIIGSTVPHFVRCIKPNMDKRDGLFDWNIAERQITTGGVVDAVAIVQQGFPYRRPCSEFAERYSHLVPSLRSADYAALKQQKLGSTAAAASGEYVSSSFKKRVSIAGDSGISQASGAARFVRMPDVQRCSLILHHLGVSQDRFAVGKSLLFLKAGVIGLLEDESARQRYYYATLLSKNATRFIVLRRYKAARRALLLLQCAWRCSRARNLLHRKRTLVAQLLQKHIRCCLCRVPFVRNHAARTLGAACRQRLCRVPYVRNRVACTLHAACRSALVGRSYRAQLNQIYHKAKVDALAVLGPSFLRVLLRIRYARSLQVRLALCLACGPAIKRRLPAVTYRKQYAAVIVGLRSRLLAAKYRKRYAAYIIGLRFKTKKVLPEFKENPIRVAFTQKREFQGTLEKKVNFLRWNARFFRLNFANGSLEYQEQEGRGEFYGELFFSQDSAVEKQGITFKLSGTPNRKNHGQKMIYYLRAASQPEADRWVENLKKLIDEVKRRPVPPKKPAHLGGGQ